MPTQVVIENPIINSPFAEPASDKAIGAFLHDTEYKTTEGG
jgi:hypothetical protein